MNHYEQKHKSPRKRAAIRTRNSAHRENLDNAFERLQAQTPAGRLARIKAAGLAEGIRAAFKQQFFEPDELEQSDGGIAR